MQGDSQFLDTDNSTQRLYVPGPHVKQGTNPKKEYTSRANFLKIGFNDPNPGPGTYTNVKNDWCIGTRQDFTSARRNVPKA